MSKTTQVEEYFGEGHLIPMGNGASQCKYCGASFLPSWEDKPETPTEQSGKVDESVENLGAYFEVALKLQPQQRKGIESVIREQIKQLLTHLSTSGNNMSDKRTVTREWVNQYAWDILTDFNTLPKTNEIRNMEKRLHDVLKELGIEVKE